MRIPRQSDRSRATRAEHPDDAAGLRARRHHLVEQLRAVGYWQRLVQARTDLLVAGLLYSAPVPTALARSDRPAGTVADEADLAGLANPPEGLDVRCLLAGAAADGPGAQLDRLRAVTSELVRRSRALLEELDVVTTALHEQLARDGAATTVPTPVPTPAPTHSLGLSPGQDRSGDQPARA